MCRRHRPPRRRSRRPTRRRRLRRRTSRHRTYQPPPYQPEPPTTQYTAPPPASTRAPAGPTTSPYGVVPQENTSLNGFAVASLILGICGGLLLSVIFGIVALVQIKRNGGRGRGMAIAGWCSPGVWLLAIVPRSRWSSPLAVAPTTTRDPVSGQVTESGSVSLADLKLGDCITAVTEDELRFALPVVPCTEPHRTEVTSIETMFGDSYPGDDVVDETAGNLCTDAAARYAPTRDGGRRARRLLLPAEPEPAGTRATGR